MKADKYWDKQNYSGLRGKKSWDRNKIVTCGWHLKVTVDHEGVRNLERKASRHLITDGQLWFVP